MDAVGGDHLIENSQMIGDRIRHKAICCGRQHNMPPCIFLSVQIFQQGLVIGQQRRVHRRPGGDRLLESGTAAKYPEQRSEQGRVHRERANTLVQHVGPDQRAVEVDTERQGLLSWSNHRRRNH